MGAHTDIWEPGELPEMLDLYREVAGTAAMLKLAHGFGGRRLYLPSPDRLHDGQKLVVELGMEAATILCRDFGPGDVDVPMGPASRRSLKPVIQRLLREGELSRAEIATRLACSERRVYQVWQEMREAAPPDPSLFD